MEKFYVHSEEDGGIRQWAVFERSPANGARWQRRSKFFKTAGPAEKICESMNKDWLRYQAAMAASARR